MNSYYHTLDSGNSTPLDLLINSISVQELQLVSGVCRYVAGCTEYPLGISGTLFTSFGAVWETWPDLLADGTRIGDKPGRETCVVSQVVADTLARLPLEDCRDT